MCKDPVKELADWSYLGLTFTGLQTERYYFDGFES